MANDYGVSPVIGVMLMIVVTVIVAAVVSAFAGSMSHPVKAAPTATFEFQIYEKYVGASFFHKREDGAPYVIANLKSGETLDTRDLKIVSTRKDADGNPVVFTYDPSSSGYKNPGGSSGPMDLRSWSGNGYYKYFGDTTRDGAYWRAGDRYTGGPAYVLGTTPKMGDVFQIEVIHKPSNLVIWSSEVIVI